MRRNLIVEEKKYSEIAKVIILPCNSRILSRNSTQPSAAEQIYSTSGNRVRLIN